MRAKPPSRRMSEGTRSRAITATAPASSATFASSGVTTSMITPPFSISARPVFSRNVARSGMPLILKRRGGWPAGGPAAAAGDLHLLQFVGLDAVPVQVFVAGVQPVGERLDEGHQGRVAAVEGRGVGREVASHLAVLTDL